MTWLVGVDEAGYGPNLGPLAIAATAWHLPLFDCTSADAAPDLYELLDSAVSNEPDGTKRIAIADSKRLYKPRGGLQNLERGLFAALEHHDGRAPESWNDLLKALGIPASNGDAALPWQRGFNPSLPADLNTESQRACRQMLSQACESASIGNLQLRAKLIQPAEFNDLIDKFGTKGAALSHLTLGLLKSLLAEILLAKPGGKPQSLGAICTLDKHGGRSKYCGLLQHHFPEDWIETLRESRAASSYAWGTPERRITASFRVGGESFLPTALASMIAKYLREVSMRGFNEYWSREVPGIKPTAGYPVDAKRFRAEIAQQQRTLNIDDRILWRNR